MKWVQDLILVETISVSLYIPLLQQYSFISFSFLVSNRPSNRSRGGRGGGGLVGFGGFSSGFGGFSSSSMFDST